MRWNEAWTETGMLGGLVGEAELNLGLYGVVVVQPGVGQQYGGLLFTVREGEKNMEIRIW